MVPCSLDEILVVFALEAEAQACFSEFHTVYSGVGKINATYALTCALYDWEQKQGKPPRMVINAGSAGSVVFPQGHVVNCTRFIQRDMLASALGLESYATPFDPMPAVLENGIRCDALPEGICGTGDSFAVDGALAAWTVVDMEAYALAKVCALRSIPFCCLKYITDGADGDASLSWKEKLGLAAKALRVALDASVRIS